MTTFTLFSSSGRSLGLTGAAGPLDAARLAGPSLAVPSLARPVGPFSLWLARAWLGYALLAA